MQFWGVWGLLATLPPLNVYDVTGLEALIKSPSDFYAAFFAKKNNDKISLFFWAVKKEAWL